MSRERHFRSQLFYLFGVIMLKFVVLKVLALTVFVFSMSEIFWREIMDKITYVSLLLIVLLMSTLGVDVVYGQASSFSVRGNVTEADGTAVGEGYTVKAVNQRVSGSSIYSHGKKSPFCAYMDIMFKQFFGTISNVGVQLVWTVSENATG